MCETDTEIKIEQESNSNSSDYDEDDPLDTSTSSVLGAPQKKKFKRILDEKDVSALGKVLDDKTSNDDDEESFEDLDIKQEADSTEEVITSDEDEDDYQIKKSRGERNKAKTIKIEVEKIPASTKKTPKSEEPKVPKKRGRKKDPRRLDGREDTTSEEELDDEKVPVRFGTGYHVLYKQKVLKYAKTHSNSATAEKFGIKPSLVREWRKQKNNIENPPKRRPRGDHYTVEEKLQAVAFAAERSIDEARLLYNVHKCTIEKWRAMKDRLEEKRLNGLGGMFRQAGQGPKPKFTHIEEDLRNWILALRLKNIAVNPRMILIQAKELLQEKADGQEEVRAPRSSSWVVKFLRRHNLYGLLGTTLGHENISEILQTELITDKANLTTLATKINEVPENPNQRNRKIITLDDKLKMIARMEGGESQMSVAKSLHLATSTVQGIWSCRHEILKKSEKSPVVKKSGTLFWRKYSVIAAALQDWYEQSTHNIDARTLTEKAIQLSETYRLPEFKNDYVEWIKLFCKRRNLKHLVGELTGSIPASKETMSEQYSMDVPSESADNNMEFCPSNNVNSFEFGCPGGDLGGVKDPITVSRGEKRKNERKTELVQQTTHLSNPQCLSDYSKNIISQPPQLEDALANINSLRSWITASYGANEIELNNHLNAFENALLKKRNMSY